MKIKKNYLLMMVSIFGIVGFIIKSDFHSNTLNPDLLAINNNIFKLSNAQTDIQTSFDNNAERYVIGSDAYVSGTRVNCNDIVHLIKCYVMNGTKYCEFDKIKKSGSSSFVSASGKVYRQRLSNEKIDTCQSVYKAYFHEDSYVGSLKIDGHGLGCGANTEYYSNGVCHTSGEKGSKISLPNTKNLASYGRKFIGWAADTDGKDVNCTGSLVNGDSVYITGNVHYYACYEPEKGCENTESIIDGKGTYTVNVCYNAKKDNNGDINISPVSNDYDDILSCASGYILDSISETNIVETSCIKEGSCYQKYELDCISASKPKISATSAMVGDNGYGTINFSVSSNTLIKGYYVSNVYEKPTINSEWIMDSRGNYTYNSTPGSVFLWAIDDNDQISYAVMTSVIDKMNVDTTAKSLSIKTNDGVNLNPEVYSYSVSDYEGITSSDYVRLTNKIVDDSKILASAFNPFDTAYKVTTSSNKIAVYATLTSNDASYVAGYEPRTVELNYGVNTILIKIQNSKGKVRTYTIIATREDDRDSSNLLKSLKVSDGKINFDPYKSDYVVSVAKNKNEVSINAEVLSDKSMFADSFGPRKIELNDDSTTAMIKVKSQTGTIRSYTITFVKKGEETSNKNEALLSSLSLSKAFIAFDKNVNDYNTTVDYEIDLIDIYALASNGGDSISLYKMNDGIMEEINNTNILLNVGSNNITIVVATPEGKTRTYSINIVRKENGLEISSDTKLSMLDVNGYDIEFSPDKYNYEIKIKREKTLLITATPLSNRAEVYIRGNENLTAFSIVKVKVIAEDGQFKEYTIDIKKDTFNRNIEIIGLISGVIIIICGIIIIRVKRRRKSINDYYAE